MRYVLVTIVCLIGLRNYSKGNNDVKSDSLIFIKNYPMKIDGGASYFTFDSVRLDSKKFILIINKDKQAFIQTSKGFVYFNHKKREVSEKGYKDFYSNKQSLLTLNITNIRKAGDYNSIRSGTLELKGVKTLSYKIRGNVEEFDNYNYPNRLK